MECGICGIEKLGNEFPPEPVTDRCRHPVLSCLRCTIKIVKETGRCPHEGCDNSAKLSDPTLEWFEAILCRMFTEYDTTYTSEVVPPVTAPGTLTITVLTGECMQVQYKGNMLIQELKQIIHTKLQHEVNKQKLLYKETEIEVYKKDGQLATLSDYGVKPNTSICLVVLLFSIPDSFDHVVFDLHWGYPVGRRDYLDASCLLFSGQSYVEKCDYCHSRNIKSRYSRHGKYIQHSGDVMDNENKIGHHTINVHLKEIPANITHLFFTLSAYMSPNIAKYPNPSLKFHEADSPNKGLCKTTFTHAGHSQAVIMCSLSKGSKGKWEIFESGKLSSGNVSDYDPLVASIKSLISKGF